MRCGTACPVHLHDRGGGDRCGEQSPQLWSEWGCDSHGDRRRKSGGGNVSVNVPLTSGISFTPDPNFGDLAVGVTSLAASNRVLEYNTDSFPADATSSIVGPNASDFSLVQQNTVDESNPDLIIDYFYVKFTPSGVGLRAATLVTTYGNISLAETVFQMGLRSRSLLRLVTRALVGMAAW